MDMSDSRKVEFFFSFRSPYSYLAGPRAFELSRDYNIEFLYRGIRPMVTRGVPLPMSKELHILFDAEREAERLGMLFGKMYDPLGPGALRCLYVAEYAFEQDKGRQFVLAASRAIWGEGVCVAEDAGLKAICDTLGLDWTGCKTAIDNTEIHARIEGNNARLNQLGQWGVPTFYYGGELYWGQDRIPDLERKLTEDQLKK